MCAAIETMWKWWMTFIAAGVTFIIPLLTSAGEVNGTKSANDLYTNFTIELHADVKFKCNATKDKSDESAENFAQIVDQIKNVSFTDQGSYTCYDPDTRPPGQFFLVVTASEPKPQIIVIICISCAAVVALIVVVTAAICLIRRCKRTMEPKIVERIAPKKVLIIKPTIDEINSASILPIPRIRIQRQQMPLPSGPQQSAPSRVMVDYDIPYDSRFEFPRNKLLIDKVINEGVFNRIYVAHANVHQRKLKRTVAVKTLKTKYTDADLVNLLCEMEIMKMIGSHPNIINLIGCCSQAMPLFVIIEYAAHGNLRDYLRGEYEASKLDNREDCFTSKELTDFVLQAAEGMKYLTMKKVNGHQFVSCY